MGGVAQAWRGGGAGVKGWGGRCMNIHDLTAQPLHHNGALLTLLYI